MNQSKFNDLQDKVIAWGTERNFYNKNEGTTAKSQFLKLVEEFGEIAGGIARNKPELIKDAIGDCIVVALAMIRLVQPGVPLVRVKLSSQSIFSENPADKIQGLMFDFFSLNFDETDIPVLNVIINALIEMESDYGFKHCECLEFSYNEIKDRKGKMLNRVFVKESDFSKN